MQIIICAMVLLFAGEANALPFDVGGTRQGAQQYPDNVVIVLDASGSMNDVMEGDQRRIDAAKRALRVVLKQLPETTHVGLLVFSAVNTPDEWVYPLGPLNQARLMAAVDLPEPHGGTPLGEYIKKGADALLGARERQFGYGTYRLLVVTDGVATDQSVMEQNTPEVVARGLTLDVIGVDMAGEHTLARYAHSYRSANDPRSLEKAIREVFAEVDSAATTNDVAGADAFDLLDGLEPEVAQAMIDALTRTGNHPIGTQPPDQNAREAGRRGMRHTPDPQGSAGGGGGGNQQLPPGCEGCGQASPLFGGLAIALMGLIFLLRR